jgi:NAD(P)-dependent dehydrogenase (short-subunit alcohol dehydrogenase family)
MAAGTTAQDLSERVVLVTGAGRGLGRALVARVLAHGARVGACARSRDDLETLRTQHAAAADRLLVVQADVTNADAMTSFAAQADERWSRIDGLIVNAAMLGERGALRDADVATWRQVIDVNLTGAFLSCRAVLPAMRRARGGSIVLVSSGVGDRPRTDWGAYAVSKWALEGFGRNLALEERDAGIRVNIVDPGPMRTTMRAAAYPAEDPMRLAPPEQRTDVYLWLLAAASAGTTGERFHAAEWRQS